MKIHRKVFQWYRIVVVYQCILLIFVISSCNVDGSDTATYIQQFQRVLSRTLGKGLGIASLLLKNVNPPTTVELIRRHGYPVETHYTKTEDNVVLEIHRIPHGPTLELFRLNKRVPVILMHGIAQSSSDWFLNTPIRDSLGFLLSSEGYDVWVGNHRGNLNKNSGLGVVSWNYSFHEMGIYDVPAIVNYVTEYTGFAKVHYVAFSMGNTALMAALSKRPELNSKIRSGIILGPSIFQDNYFNGWLKLVAPLAWPAEALQSVFKSVPLLHPIGASILHRILPVICSPKIDLIGICLTINSFMFGNDKGQITKEKLALVTQVSPTPLSSKLIVHYMQELGSGRFCEYDYGPQKNLQLYGTTKSPDYNLTNVIAPMSIMVGQEDLNAHKLDAMTLAKKLPNVVDLYFVPYQHFTHLDFCYADDVGTLVYDRVTKLLRRFDR